MKKIQIALVALAMAAVPAGAHVFDDAVFYFNGGKDVNGDGATAVAIDLLDYRIVETVNGIVSPPPPPKQEGRAPARPLRSRCRWT